MSEQNAPLSTQQIVVLALLFIPSLIAGIAIGYLFPKIVPFLALL